MEKLRRKQPSGFMEKATKRMEKEKALPKVTGSCGSGAK